MGLRTLLLSLVLAVLIPVAVFKPWIGILGWTWIGLMNPHRLTFDFLFYAPVAATIGGATLIGLVFTRDKRMPPLNAITLTLLAFIAWMCVTTWFALYPERVGTLFTKVMKVQFMLFVTLALLYTRRHLDWLVWTIALSVAFFGVKGGIFTIATGGKGRVWGPPGGWIESNNELGLALIMTIPLLVYLRSQIAGRWPRHALLGAMLLCALSALGTQSRGAFLAIVAMAVWLWWRSNRKLAAGAAIVVLGIVFLLFMPERWEERMRSIGTYEQDTSAMGRINAWMMAWNLARDRFIGGGFEVTMPETFARYAPDPTSVKAAHSIYFQVLGEHGFIGLFLFLLLYFVAWRSAGWIVRNARLAGMPELGSLAAAIQVSFVGFLVGGAFLSLAYFDMPYLLMLVIVIARGLVEERLREQQAVTQPMRVGPATSEASR
jgi:probable O-glycosylation ligase (exosortase A-associated)